MQGLREIRLHVGDCALACAHKTEVGDVLRTFRRVECCVKCRSVRQVLRSKPKEFGDIRLVRACRLKPGGWVRVPQKRFARRRHELIQGREVLSVRKLLNLTRTQEQTFDLPQSCAQRKRRASMRSADSDETPNV